MGRIVTTCAWLALATVGRAQVTLFVDADATGANDGSSWANAFAELQDGLAAASSGDRIWVAEGTYLPDWDPQSGVHTGSRTASFPARPDVKMFGGFAGFEHTLAERDILGNPTILSGDLNGDDAPGFQNRSDNSYHILVNQTKGLEFTADGFTFVGGQADGPTSFDQRGSVIYNSGGRLFVEACRMIECFASDAGGAVYNVTGGMILKQCLFKLNESRNGGAIYNTSAQSGTDQMGVLGCTLLGNKASGSGGGGNGGGLANVRGFITVQSSTFDNNRAEGNGGGAYDDSLQGQFIAVNTTFVRNVAGRNGGGYAKRIGGATFQMNVRYVSNKADIGGGMALFPGSFPLFLTNGLFAGNSAGTRGGAIDVQSQSPLILTNCTVVANTAPLTGGLHAQATGGTYNTIFWGNTDDGPDLQASQLVLASGGDVRFTSVEGWDGTLGGATNDGSMPLFADPFGPDGMLGTLDDDYRQVSGSPMVDSGANAFTQQVGATLDLDLTNRFKDDPSTPDTGVGIAPIVDRGAYELKTSP